MRLALALSWSLLAAACSSLSPDLNDLKEPKVALTGLTLTDANPLSPSFLVRLRVDNPNDRELNLDGADAVLSLDGKPVAKGVSRGPVTLVRQGRSDVDVEVTAHTLKVLQKLLKLQHDDQLNYGVEGHLQLLNWLGGGLGSVPFRAHGIVTREQLMKGLDR